MFLVALFVVGVQGMGLCLEPGIAQTRIDAEGLCKGATDCFDGCDICGSAMCDLQVEFVIQSPACVCDYWMCYSYCAKSLCEPSVLALAAAECSGGVAAAEAAGYAVGCSVNCMSASALSALAALVFTFGVSW